MSFRIATRSLTPLLLRRTQLAQAQVQAQVVTRRGMADDATSLKDKAAQKLKETAQKFKADGEIGSKFTSEGEVGKKFDQEVGGAFSKE